MLDDSNVSQAIIPYNTDGNTALQFAVAPDPSVDSEQLELIYNLSAMGLNIFPIEYGCKTPVRGLQWGRVTRSFNDWNSNHNDAQYAFGGLCNYRSRDRTHL